MVEKRDEKKESRHTRKKNCPNHYRPVQAQKCRRNASSMSQRDISATIDYISYLHNLLDTAELTVALKIFFSMMKNCPPWGR